MTKKVYYYPQIDNSADTDVLSIGIGYTKILRDQWYPVSYSIKRVYISQNLLVAATLPDLDRMKAYDY